MQTKNQILQTSRLSENLICAGFLPRSTLSPPHHLPWRAMPGKKPLQRRVLCTLSGSNWHLNPESPPADKLLDYFL